MVRRKYEARVFPLPASNKLLKKKKEEKENKEKEKRDGGGRKSRRGGKKDLRINLRGNIAASW